MPTDNDKGKSESLLGSIAKRGVIGTLFKERVEKRERPSTGTAIRKGLRGLQEAEKALEKANRGRRSGE